MNLLTLWLTSGLNLSLTLQTSPSLVTPPAPGHVVLEGKIRRVFKPFVCIDMYILNLVYTENPDVYSFKAVSNQVPVMPFADQAVRFYHPFSALPSVTGVILELDPAIVPERLQQFGEYFTHPGGISPVVPRQYEFASVIHPQTGFPRYICI